MADVFFGNRGPFVPQKPETRWLEKALHYGAEDFIGFRVPVDI